MCSPLLRGIENTLEWVGCQNGVRYHPVDLQRVPACRYQRSVFLPVPVEEAFAFHLNPENLRRISPPWTPVYHLKVPPRLDPGARVEVGVRILGIWPQDWVVQIAEVLPSERLVDIALSGPFPAWRHTHSFHPEAGGTWMTDLVEYDPPLGRWGRWAAPWAIQPMLTLLFWYRHARTKALLQPSS